MGAKESDRGRRELKQKEEEDVRRSSRRFVIILVTFILLLFALTVWALSAIYKGQQRRSRQTDNRAVSSSNYRVPGALARKPSMRATMV